MDFPSLKSQRLLAILENAPLSYVVVRQNGSHRRLEAAGRPPLGFSWHDGVTINGGVVKKVLVKDVGLSESDALDAIKGKLK